MRVLTLILLLLNFNSFAGTIGIPLNDHQSIQEPASDLLYQDQNIDSSRALELKENGFDISKLNPKTSNLYKNEKLSNNKTITLRPNEILTYQSTKISPTEIFRFYAKDKNNKKILMTASLDNHTNIIRSLLLRSIGYDINRPSLSKEITISFRDEKEKEVFLDNLSEQTLTSRARWIVKEDETELTLRHILVDEPELKNVNLYLPVMTKSRQANRRIFRSLLALYAITDFSESVNKISWNIGTVFNNSLSISHPYATSFKNTTEDDLKWILRELNNISREELTLIVKEAKYPKSVQGIIVEKLISRIVSLGQKLRVNTSLKPNTKLTNKYVQNGKLIKKDYENTAINYSTKDIPSPYRFKELFRLFGTQAVFNGLSELLDKGMESYVPGLYNNDAVRDIQNQIADYRQENPSSDGTLPLKAFTSPTLFGKVFANRNIVFGQVLDTNAAIQLVDSVGVEVNLGLQGRVTGVTNSIIPNIGLNTSVTRTYTHVRAMPDLKTASEQSALKILVPRLMKKLGKIIKSEYICSLSKKPFVDEIMISEEIFHYIKYDERISAREDALKLREELLSSGIESNKILILKINRTKLCVTDLETTKDKSINEFLKSFAENETFIISDSIRLAGTSNVPIPLLSNANLTLGVDQSKTLVRSIQLRKIEDNIQVTITQQKDRSTRVSESVSFFIQIARNSDLFQKGNQKAKVYTVNIKEESKDKQDIALRVIRNLFVKNDKTELYKQYKANELEHKVNVHVNTLKVLWFKKDKFKMGHDLSVIIPNKEKENYSLKERTRSFYQHFDYKRTGSDFHSFTNDVLGFFSDVVSLGQASNDPGKTFLGNSKKTYFLTEAETTEGYAANPTTRIEFIRSGWSKRHKKVDKYFQEIDDMFSFSKNYNPIDRSILHGSSKLQSFDIRSTLIIYPNAMTRLQDKILNTNKQNQIRLLNYLSDTPQDKQEKRKARILKRMLWKVSKSYINTKDKVKEINKTFKWLFLKFNKSKVLSLIGEENFFATTRVIGFLKDHHKGFLEHSTDSIGSYNKSIGTGQIDQISSMLGISSYQLRALNYSPGL